jgi:HK97 family phage major capsid protein
MTSTSRFVRQGDAWFDTLTARTLPRLAGADPVTDRPTETLARLERAYDAFEALDATATAEDRSAAEQAFQAADRAHSLAVARHATGNLEEPTVRAGGARRGTPELTPEMRMADWAPDHLEARSGFTPAQAQEFSLGRVMRALVDTRARDQLTEVEQRALAEGTDSAGGFLTPEPLAVDVIDKVRNAARVFQAGATTVPMTSDKQSIPRLTGDPSGGWRAENGAYAANDATFDRVSFVAKAWGLIVNISDELFEDMVPGGEAAIENAITTAAALALDVAALRGTGASNQPTGILNQAGVTKVLLGSPNGATPTYANLMTGITALLNANREPNALVWAPRTSQTFASLTDTTGQPLNPPAPVAELAKYTTNQIPVNITKGTSSDCSEIYEAYWPDLLVGLRVGIEVKLLDQRYADVGQLAWRVRLRGDVQLRHAESFYVLEGVRP